MKNLLCTILFCFGLIHIGYGQASLQQQFYKIDSVYNTVRENDLSEAFRLVLQEDSVATLSGSDSLQLLAKFHKAQTLILTGFEDIALKELYAGLKKAEHVKARYFVYRYNYSIGQIYEDLGDNDNALKFYNVTKQKAIENGNLKDTLFINPDIAFVYLYMGDKSKSLAMIKQNMAVSKAIVDSISLFFAFDHLAGYYAVTGNLEAALPALQEVLNYPKTITSNYRRNLLYSHLAEITAALKDWPQAGKYCDSMFKYADLVKSPVWLSLCYRMRSKVEEANDDCIKALADYKLYFKLTDSLNKVNYGKKMTVMTTFYELDKKQDQIVKLAKDKQINIAKIGRLTLAIVALVLLSVLVILYIYYRKNKTEKHLKEQFARQLLDSQEAERQRLAKELHDSLGQNMLFIINQLQGEQIDREKLKQSVAQALEEIRNISKDLYPNQLEKYGLAAAVDALGEQVQASTGIFVSSDMQGVDEALNKSTKINVYRIIQEFFNNTMKHAFASAIRITTEFTNQGVMLTLQDNGNGFNPEALSGKASRSFGLLSMEERVKMLKGKFDIHSAPGAGTKMIFTIPV